MSVVRKVVAYYAVAAIGTIAGYLAGVLGTTLLAATNVGAVVGALLPDDLRAVLLLVIGNGVFLAVYAMGVNSGFRYVRPSAPRQSSLVAAGTAVAVAVVLLLAPQVLLMPALSFVNVVAPSIAASITEGSFGEMIFVWAAFIFLGGTAGLVGGLVHAGIRSPIVVVEPPRPGVLAAPVRSASNGSSAASTEGGGTAYAQPGAGRTSPSMDSWRPTEISSPSDLVLASPDHPFRSTPTTRGDQISPAHPAAVRSLASTGYPHVARFLCGVAERADADWWKRIGEPATTDVHYRPAARAAYSLADQIHPTGAIPGLISRAIVELAPLIELAPDDQALVLAAALGLAVWPNLGEAEWGVLWSPFAEIAPFSSLWAAQAGEPDEFRSDAARAALERTRLVVRAGLGTRAQ